MPLFSRGITIASHIPAHQKRFFSAAQSLRVDLAYQLFEPPAAAKDSGHRRDGRPIIFMHGLFGSKQNNRSISKVLARDLNRDIFVVDLRNHGNSAHAPEHNYTVMAEDVENFIRQHRLEKAVLFGHSMGAKTAMTVALRSPELVTGLVPIDNAPVRARLSADFARYVKGMEHIEAAKVTKQSDADKILQEYEESLPVRQFLLTNLIRDENNNQTLKFRIPLSILGPALDNMADFPFPMPFSDEYAEEKDNQVKYDGPTLFIRGTRSRYVPDTAVPTIKRFFPRAEIADVEAGHWLVSENPEAFRQAVVKFFQENDVE
ncbi:hypothetical protein VTN77DRAFT_1535 [Rasamsonia byssochlamydoides]|uniref:uncharacterized protein n=1 Tax=Rasamsonia byssochlamydoides TaxID=89139 RepID=UPI003742ECE5